MVVSRKRKRTKKSRRATAGAGMHWGGFVEVTGASRESVLAGGDCADVATAPGRRVTLENLNLIYLCLLLPLYSTSLNFPSSSHTLLSHKHTHKQSLSLLYTYANTHRQIQHTTLIYSLPPQTLITAPSFSFTVSHACLYSLTVLCHLCVVVFVSFNMNKSQKRS